MIDLNTQHPPNMRTIDARLHNGVILRVHVCATPELKFIKGKLHQWYREEDDLRIDGQAVGAWLLVESE